MSAGNIVARIVVGDNTNNGREKHPRIPKKKLSGLFWLSRLFIMNLVIRIWKTRENTQEYPRVYDENVSGRCEIVNI